MIHSKYTWNLTTANQEQVTRLADELQVPTKFAAMLIKRKVTTALQFDKFTHPERYDGYDPFLFAEMDIAVKRIKSAIQNDEKILIYGDYDADGVTSIAVLYTTLQSLGANVDFYIPNRFTEGYGPNEKAFQAAKEEGVDLIITVDNGIAALEVMKMAKIINLDVIVTDHHEPRDVMPDATAVIHPRHPESNYPFLDLAGVGVSYKLAHALLGEEPIELLDLVAVGTVADLVSLTDENRLFVQKGLKKLQTNPNIGLDCLAKKASVKLTEANAEMIGFILAPRLNAVGRLGSADPACELLLARDKEAAALIAAEIDEANKERKEIVQQITQEAKEIIAEYDRLPAFLVLAKAGWNQGVLGIVASRLVEKYNRPTIVMAIDQTTQMAKGSGRSVSGFHLYEALDKNRELIESFGGHPMAAGLTISLNHFEVLQQNLITQAEQADISAHKNELIIEDTLALEDVSLALIQMIAKLAPFGTDNPKPIFQFRSVHFANAKRIGADKTHLKTTLTNQSGGDTIDVIGFGQGDLVDEIARNAEVSVAGELTINEWNNIRRPQLRLIDSEVSHWQLFDVRGQTEWRRIKTSVNKDCLFVCFNKDTATQLTQEVKHVTCLSNESTEYAQAKELVFVDMPDSTTALEQLLQEVKPERIYIHFGATEIKEIEKLPDRKAFASLYALIKKYQPFDLEKYQPTLLKQFGWTIEKIQFMTNVFFDLDFVSIQNGMVHLKEPQSKRSLTESATYKLREQQILTHQKLLYASYNDLYSWMKQIIE